MVNVLIASFLEEEHIATIREVSGVSVRFERDLVPPARYPADHVGGQFTRDARQEEEWLAWLREAEILFDFDRTHARDLPDLAPNVRWIQGTSAGIGQYVVANEYHVRMPQTIFTTASGVHAQPLAEYCAMSMLMFSRGLFRVWEQQQRRHWQRYAGTDLRGRTVVIVGLGAIGTEVARLSQAFGMHVIGIKRNVADVSADASFADELLTPAGLDDVLGRAEFLVLVAPHTPETEGMIGREQIQRLPPGAIVINIGRGPLIDEPALIDGLASGHLGGASLDVFRTEPLPEDNPLWRMPNVLVSPHSGSTSDRENARITDLFCDNLRRYIDGRPLRNTFDSGRFY